MNYQTSTYSCNKADITEFTAARFKTVIELLTDIKKEQDWLLISPDGTTYKGSAFQLLGALFTEGKIDFGKELAKAKEGV